MGATSEHRRPLPPWAPIAIVWGVWTSFQVWLNFEFWGTALPRPPWLLVPQILLPFDAAMPDGFAYFVPLLTPLALVLLELAALSHWSLKSAVPRYALVAAWFGLSAALAPSIGMGVVWTGGLSAVEIAREFLIYFTLWFVQFVVAALLVAGVLGLAKLVLANKRLNLTRRA